jgi:hypothetical protein
MAVDNNKVPSWGELQPNITEVYETPEDGTIYAYKWFKMGRLVYVNGTLSSYELPEESTNTATKIITLTTIPIPAESVAVATFTESNATCSARIYTSSNVIYLRFHLAAFDTATTDIYNSSIQWTCCYMTNE